MEWVDVYIKNSGADTLVAGESMRRGDKLVSASGNAQFVLQSSDGNLVLYSDGHAVWSAKSTNNGDRLEFQESDGNLVLYGTTSQPLWSSNPHSGAAKLVLQDDCNVVALDSNAKVLWSLGTSCN